MNRGARYYRRQGDAIVACDVPIRAVKPPHDKRAPGLVSRVGNATVITRFVGIECGRDAWGEPLLYETVMIRDCTFESTTHASPQEAIAAHCLACWSIGG